MVNAKFLLYGFAAFAVVSVESSPIENNTNLELPLGPGFTNTTALLETIRAMQSKTGDDLAVAVSAMAQLRDSQPNDTTNIIGDILWPMAFTSICNSLDNISANLGRMLDRFTGPGGAQCTDEQRNRINTPASCSRADQTADLVTNILWPLAFQGLAETSDKIAAQASCLVTILVPRK